MVNRERLTKLATLAITVVCQFVPSDAVGQQRLSLDGRVGIAVPMGSLADFESGGASFGAGLAFRVRPEFSLRTGVDMSFLEGKRLDSGTTAPGVNLIHYFIAAELPIPVPRAPLSMAAVLGAGATMLVVESFVIPIDRPGGGQTFAISEVYPTLQGGVQVGYALSRRLDFVFSGRLYRVFVDEDDTVVLERLSDDVDRFGAAWVLPITVGGQIRM